MVIVTKFYLLYTYSQFILFFFAFLGTIYTKQIFDRETCSHFWLTIKVQDNGLTPRFGRLEVLIRIQDVNDNIPQSIEPAYYASVEENSVQGTSVVKVEATDGDSNSEQKLYFAITGGNTENFFIIDPITGKNSEYLFVHIGCFAITCTDSFIVLADVLNM